MMNPSGPDSKTPRDPQEPTADPADRLLDQAVAALQADLPPEAAVAAAGQRAWARIAAATAPDAAGMGAAGETDYHALIPAYLAGTLPPSQAMLVADHVREDAAFRAEVEAARTGVAPRRLTVVGPAPALAGAAGAGTTWLRRRRAWSLAAAAVAVLALGSFLFARDFLQPDRVLAQVAEVDGGLVAVADALGSRPLAAGDAIRPRQQLRAARGGGAVVTLNDGTTIELGPRAELSLASRWNGLAIELARGDIIVHAADQGRGRLHVATEDLDAAVHGTIFAVRHGTKGSRVSVIEGEVEVAGAQGRRMLESGMQYSSRAAVGAVPVADDVAWSRHSAEYLKILSELEKLGREIDASVERPAPRRASALVGLVPADTAVFVALPNLGRTVAASYDRFRAGVAENPVLRDWWAQSMDDPKSQAHIDKLVAALAEIGEGVGDEIVVAAGVDASGEIAVPVVYAQVADSAAFRSLLELKIADIEAEIEAEVAADARDPGSLGDAGDSNGSSAGGTAEDRASLPIQIVTDRAELDAQAGAELDTQTRSGIPAGLASGDDDALVVWLGDGLVIASPSAARVAAALDGPRGLPEPFRAVVDEGHARGVDALMAIDVPRLTLAARAAERGGHAEADTAGDGDADRALTLSGLDGARYAVATQVTQDGRSQIEASLSFDGEREGMAGWLAAPGPMGALDFVSPSAYAAGAALIDRPERVVAEFLGLARAGDPELADDPDVALGTELLAEIAKPLGGEVAFALDGPVLPKPAWKMVVEVTDPAALQAAIERVVARLNERLIQGERQDDGVVGGAYGLAPRRLVLESAELDGRPLWSLSIEGAVELRAMHWLYADGYLVAASDPGLLAAALRTRASGVTLRNAAPFVAALPEGAETDFSAVVWQDLGRLTSAIAEAAPQAADSASGGAAEGAPDLDVMRDLALGLTPALAYAWAEPDRLRLAASSDESPFGMGFLFQLLGNAGAEDGSQPPLPELDGLPMPFDDAAWVPET